MKIRMFPEIEESAPESGMKMVVLAYKKYLPEFGIEVVGSDDYYDLIASHAGAYYGPQRHVSHLHGLYWTAEYDARGDEWGTNKYIAESIRMSRPYVTVPSEWVAKNVRRGCRFDPTIVPHGIDHAKWGSGEFGGYVLWNKNRNNMDVTHSGDLEFLARNASGVQFVSTFANIEIPNLTVTGALPHVNMIKMVNNCDVYLSTTKETFGIGVLEAMAAGKPVLGWNEGGNIDLIEHKVNGYLAEKGNYQDLIDGLLFCLKNKRWLGENGQEMSQKYTWQNSVAMVAKVYKQALAEQPPTVDVVIPVYNKPKELVSRAVMSAVNQSLRPSRIFLIDDGSTEHNYFDFANNFVTVVRQSNQGVAHARNNGIAMGDSKYVACLDGDDEWDIDFLKELVGFLETKKSIDIAYSKMKVIYPSGDENFPEWPGQWDFDEQLKGNNQVPTSCVFTRYAWKSVGGYRQRYAPMGAGTEDAEFWTRLGAWGFRAALATDRPLFHHRVGIGLTSQKEYSPVDFHEYHPYTMDFIHPFISCATPHLASHPVHDYSDPDVSVIIPVGPGHHKNVVDAIDSVEGQTFRHWEIVVVWDNEASPKFVKDTYPFVKVIETAGGIGAGKARNLGVEEATASMVFFLDADDTLMPNCLTECINAWNDTGMIPYPDFVGVGMVEESYLQDKESQGKLIDFNPSTGVSVWEYDYIDFDRDKALREPSGDYHDWSTVNILLPKKWHDQVNGFDEELHTWEDWEYKLRLVKAGYEFVRVPKILMSYNVNSGSRRLAAKGGNGTEKKDASAVLKYIMEKHNE